MVCPPLLQAFVPSWLKIAPSTTRHDIHIAALIRFVAKILAQTTRPSGVGQSGKH
jgi:hypothetical protein